MLKDYKKYKVVALFGESSSGKDTIQNWLVTHKENTNKIVNITTRPKRDYEVEGIDYHFMSEPMFLNRVDKNYMLDVSEFNGWFYGTSIESLDIDKINIGVFNPVAVSRLMKDPRLEVVPIYIYASEKTRLMRSLEREKNPDCKEICRRFLADKRDFENIDFEYEIFNNETGASKIEELNEIVVKRI